MRIALANNQTLQWTRLSILDARQYINELYISLLIDDDDTCLRLPISVMDNSSQEIIS
jgi:hypothetical protein